MSAAKRPWWVPLLGVGSIGLGGLQALGGIAMAAVAAEVGGPPAAVLLGLGAAWFVPGAILGISGIGVVIGARWGRSLSLAAAGAMLLALGIVAFHRRAIPGAVADVVVHAERGAEGMGAELLRKYRSGGREDPVAVLRDPELSAVSAWVFTGECGCGLPWYLVVFAVCALPAGRAIVIPTPSGASRTGAP